MNTTVRLLPTVAYQQGKGGWKYTDYVPVTLSFDGPSMQSSRHYSALVDAHHYDLQREFLDGRGKVSLLDA